MTLTGILKDSNYKLTQFSAEKIKILDDSIILKESKDKLVPFIICLVRKKEIKLTPEEVIRQLYVMVLKDDFGYPVSKMELEYGVSFGREKKRADIVVFDKDQTTTPYIIVELKKPRLKDGKEQLKSYCNATGAPIGIWSNGESISYYHRKDPNYFEDIPNIPRFDQKLSDILEERWTIDDLIAKDKLVTERKSLKDLILEMEDEVLANAGVDVFEELFKLIFTKLFDEMESGRNRTRHLEFRNYGDTETELKNKLQHLFDQAKKKWAGVFNDDDKMMLTPSHLSICVASLQDVKLFNSNLDVVDEAFEYLINKSSKGEKGQYFTPRYVIDMAVKMLNPQPHETMIDTAAGSCGFPVHTIFHVWEQILKNAGLDKSHLFTLESKPTGCTDYVQEKVFAIDFDEKAVRVGRTLNLIAGDGQTNILHLNTLDWERWDEKTRDEDWLDIYNTGWIRFKKMRTLKGSNRDFGFDILMANPPFAGDIKESRILARYELAKNAAGKYQSKVGRDILFIERNLDFLKPGGRMAIVLPQGRFNNSSDKQIREFIADRCRILAVVGLHGNVFKPHTGTKTSVLFVQKWDDIPLPGGARGGLCPRVDDYPIFFATMQEPSKDNSGEKIFVRKRDYPKFPSSGGVAEGRGGKFPSHGDVAESRGGKFPSHGDVAESRGGKFPSHGDVAEGRGGKFPSHGDVAESRGGKFPSHGDVAEGRGGKFPSHGDVAEGRGGKFPSHGDVAESRGGKFPSHGYVAEGRGGKFPSFGGVAAGRGGIYRNSANYFALPYNPALKERAKELRKAGNLAEVLFWQRVKNKQFKGLDFDRQKIIGNYIVDFYCTNHNVVVEIDGSSHDNKADYDAKRDAYLKSLGLTMIHIKDEDVKKNLDRVMEMLYAHPALTGTPPEEDYDHPALTGTPPEEGNVSEVNDPQGFYETTNKDLDEYLLDTHGHLIVKHDLFNHDGLTKDGIAEAFAEFARKERLSFF